ncbi:MAG: 2-oxo-4-hydroxy-4-carboxy-5-ureidoimidazoline decarboxylase [Henriciella sp.]|nr:2-oxo-4-hydroxy-4-carboxy-5-ureidoimidazoline decarboxylase [Henriciella sp.]
MTLEDINAMPAPAFVETFGGLYEHSPWIAAAAAALRPFDGRADMLAKMNSVVEEASEGQKLALLRAHPELAGKAAIDGTLTEASNEEQASAGLDRMHEHEYAALTQMNAAYSERFGFPFIICVKLTTKAGILEALAQRLKHTPEQEFETALEEVGKIVQLRLEGMLS